jgi:hypothetical protein
LLDQFPRVSQDSLAEPSSFAALPHEHGPASRRADQGLFVLVPEVLGSGHGNEHTACYQSSGGFWLGEGSPPSPGAPAWFGCHPGTGHLRHAVRVQESVRHRPVGPGSEPGPDRGPGLHPPVDALRGDLTPGLSSAGHRGLRKRPTGLGSGALAGWGRGHRHRRQGAAGHPWGGVARGAAGSRLRS